MPNAPTHDRITVLSALAADLAYFHYAPHPEPILAALFTGTYLFAGYACAGDLDLYSKEYQRWGPFRFLWLPYQKCVPHRSWVSHGLIMGGVIRVAYLVLMCTLVFWVSLWGYSRLGPHVDATAVTQSGWQVLLNWTQSHPADTTAALAGFILAGSAHSIADAVYTRIKRRTVFLRR